MTITALSVCRGAVSPAGESLPAAPHPLYRIKLESFVAPPTRVAGVEVKARINGGPPLRLLLDSGADYVVLDRKSALRSGCTGGENLDLVGAGALSPAVVKVQHAETVQVDEFTLRDIPVLVTDRPLADGIQGALPLSLFSGFLIRLDIPAKRLDLLPYPPEREDSAGALQSFPKNHLLFVKGTANDSHEGYFLLDTGASYTAISRNLARQLNLAESMMDRVALQGGVEALDAPLVRGAVRLRFGSRELATESIVAVDLSAASRYHQIEISGLIGYPALCNSSLLVSYRDHYIRIGTR